MKRNNYVALANRDGSLSYVTESVPKVITEVGKDAKWFTIDDAKFLATRLFMQDGLPSCVVQTSPNVKMVNRIDYWGYRKEE